MRVHIQSNYKFTNQSQQINVKLDISIDISQRIFKTIKHSFVAVESI